jgi:hypothetical protein
VFKYFKITLALSGLFVGLSTQAHTLIISDIDDTIKVSHTLNTSATVFNAGDVTTPFAGMAQLYHALINQNPHDTQIIYLSNAPKTLAGIPALQVSHQTFLNYNQFPAGQMDLREDIFDNNHKITELRKIFNDEHPDVVILFGDNGERDAEIYHQAFIEFGAKIKMVSFIHQLYNSKPSFLVPAFLSELGKPLYKEEIGYVTPIEVSIELKNRGLMTVGTYNWIMKNIAPTIANEGFWKLDALMPVAFPRFMGCRDFVWRWPVTAEVKAVYDKIKSQCR